jgi:hypothetical protein
MVASLFPSLPPLSIGRCIPVFYLVKVLRHPVLATVLILGLSRQVVGDLPSEADTGHGVEDDCIRYVVPDPHDPSVEAGLNPVDLLSIPQPHSHHRCTYIDEHGPSEAACQLFNDIWFSLSDLPSQHLDVLIDLFSREFQLFFRSHVTFTPRYLTVFTHLMPLTSTTVSFVRISDFFLFSRRFHRCWSATSSS